MKRTWITGALCALLACAGCARQATTASGIDYRNMDTTARPGDNFYRYATGNWIKQHPQPPVYPMWGSFTKLADDNSNRLATLIQDLAATRHEPGSVAQKVGDLYNLAMDSTRRNRDGAEPVLREIRQIEALGSREALIEYMAREHDNLLWNLYLATDQKDASRYVVYVAQGGLSLGNRDYYLSDDSATVAVREAGRRHAVNLFRLCGYGDEEATRRMEAVWRLEQRMAEASYSKEQQRDPEANYHKMSVAALTDRCGGFPWADFLRRYGYDRTDEVILAQPEPVALGCRMMMEEPLDDLKNYYVWATVGAASNYLSDAFTEENFSFMQAVSGAQQMPERWRRAESLVSGLMGDAIGQMYVERYFSPDAKARMLAMVADLQAALSRRIDAQEWMSDATKRVAQEKLAAYRVKVGYPDRWDDLSALAIDPDRSLYENVLAAGRFYWQLDKKKKYNRNVDPDEWMMQPQTVNAYYNPTANEICFPAGILQPPFFDPAADDAANYGAIGVVIAHEMTHGFDDQGRQYDKEGNLGPWWADEDVAAFQRPAGQMAQYFDSLWVIPGQLHANGRLCLGENIADHGGLNVAFEALQMAMRRTGRLPDERGFTPEQRFFLSFANVWASVCSEQILRYLALNDVHSADHLRVNGGVAQCDHWYEAFGILPGDSLYVAPEDRVRIW